jgi:hypothetical protein
VVNHVIDRAIVADRSSTLTRRWQNSQSDLAFAASSLNVVMCQVNGSMSTTFDLVKTIEDDEDVPDFSENSDEEEEVCNIFFILQDV